MLKVVSICLVRRIILGDFQAHGKQTILCWSVSPAKVTASVAVKMPSIISALIKSTKVNASDGLGVLKMAAIMGQVAISSPLRV